MLLNQDCFGCLYACLATTILFLTMTNESNKMPKIIAFENGKKVSPDRLVPCFDLDQNISVFESLKCYQGKIFRLDRHLDRFFESAKTTGLRIPKTRGGLKKEIQACLAASAGKDGFVRLTVDGQNSYVFLTDRKRPPSIYKTGVPLKTSVVRRNLVHASPPEAKTNAFFNCILAELDRGNHGTPSKSTGFLVPAAKKTNPVLLEGVPEVPEVLFLDREGYVTESTAWNIFMVKHGSLYTPESGILSGVTRQFVIECAQKEGLPVSETTLTRHDFWNADEAFLTNTSGEIVPIRSLDGRVIGGQVPGVITKRLMKRFKVELEKELK